MYTRVFIIVGVNTEGWSNGSESMVIVDTNKQDIFERGYNFYEKCYENNKEYLDDKDTKKETKEAFEGALEVGLNILIQCHDYHIEFALFEKNIYIEDEEN